MTQGTGHRAQGTERRAQSAGHRAQSAGHRAQSAGHRAQGTGGSDRSCRLRSETTKSRSVGSCKSLTMRYLTDLKRELN